MSAPTLNGKIDWKELSESLNSISYTDKGYTENGGTKIAIKALVEMIDDSLFIHATDKAIELSPGSELATSILVLLRPKIAMERCRELYHQAAHNKDRAIFLLSSICDKGVFEWIPEFLSDDDPSIRCWAMRIVDELVINQEAIELPDVMPLINIALNDKDTRVSEWGKNILQYAEHNKSIDK